MPACASNALTNQTFDEKEASFDSDQSKHCPSVINVVAVASMHAVAPMHRNSYPELRHMALSGPRASRRLRMAREACEALFCSLDDFWMSNFQATRIQSPAQQRTAARAVASLALTVFY